MISKDQNNALIKLAEAMVDQPDWKDYADYCLKREKGLRKQAFQKLESFLQFTRTWNLDQKIHFVKFLFPLIESIPEADYGPFPQALKQQLIKATLEEWCANETLDHRPFRWYGKYYHSEEHLLKALELKPQDDLARATLLSGWMYAIDYSTHHLPESYIGDPEADLKIANRMKEQIAQFIDPQYKHHWTLELNVYLELIENYMEWKKSGHSNLKTWGQENNKKVGQNLIGTYYYEK